MKLTAKTDFLIGGKRYKQGDVFEETENNTELLLKMGWAEVVEEIKAPKEKTPEEETPKKATKKTTKKK